MTLWDTDSQKALGKVTASGPLIDESRFVSGGFESGGSVQLKKGKTYRITIQRASSGSSTVDELQIDMHWCQFSKSSSSSGGGGDNSSSSSSDLGGTTGGGGTSSQSGPSGSAGSGSAVCGLRNGIGVFENVVWSVRKGTFPKDVVAKSRRGPSLGILVDRRQLTERAAQVGVQGRAAYS
eukprot:GSA25T00007948001.1